MSKYDYNLIVIGAGAAGLVSSYIAAATNAKVALIEKDKMGGDCLNSGCVPSKALIRSAAISKLIDRAEEFGIKNAAADIDFSAVMERVQRVIQTVEPHDSVERYTQLGVECLHGEAKITAPHSVLLNGKTLTARSIIVATGAKPFVPPIKGLDQIPYLTSDTVWNLRERPHNLAVLGGGPIGAEMAQAFARLGCRVTLIERGDHILTREDTEVIEMVSERFREDGVNILTQHQAKEVVTLGAQKILICEKGGEDVEVPFDQIIVALGRAANVTGFGLEELGVKLSPRKTIESDPTQQTNVKGLYVCGDVTGPYQFTHYAAHQAWYASVNALLRPFWSFKTDNSIVPWTTFTSPEVARAGLNEKDAIEQNIPYEVSTFDIKELDRAIAEEEAYGFIKVLTKPKSDKILGVTIACEHAGELLAEYVLAMKHGLGLNKILGTMHVYPTMAEANKYVAGEWKRNHAPKWALVLLKIFHALRRRI